MSVNTVPYATINDIFKRYPLIETMVGSGGRNVTSVDVASIFIWDAEAIVNGRLANRYEVPLPPGALVTRVTVDIALAQMIFERSGKVPDLIQARYERSMDLIDDMVAGKIIVTSATLVTSGGDNFAYSTNQGYHAVFSPVLNGEEQSVDQTWVDAERAARTDDD